jgi:phosphatidylserine/phosphatidylglycerophosphate/cardiolipin synthase-like enzyme
MSSLRAVVFLTALLIPSTVLGQSITAVYMPTAVAGSGGSGSIGYPYAAFVRIQGWTTAANSPVYLKFYYASNGNEYMWSATGQWSNATLYSYDNQPVVTLDASGNWSGWIYAKHNDNVGPTLNVRAAKVVATSTNLTSSARTLTILTMSPSGNGGWIVRSSSPAANKGLLAYSAGAIVGSYRSKDNAIAEGYAYSSGGFKIAVPAGFIDSLVSINDDGSRDQVFVGPWTIVAGQETDASVVTTEFGKGTAALDPPTLSGAVSHTVTVKVYGESPYIVQRVNVALPPGWLWTASLSDVTVSGPGAPSPGIAGDTVVVSGAAVGGSDSLLIRLDNLTPPDSTATFLFNIQTGTTADSAYPIRVQPSLFVYGVPLPISVVKEADANGVPLRINTLVTVRGIMTVARQLGRASYMQDNSGGLAVYDADFPNMVTVGDEVVVSGLLQPFAGLTEIVNPMLHRIISSGNDVEPVIVTAAQIANDGAGGVEVYEGRLVRLNGVQVLGSGAWVGATNYDIVDATGTTQLRIDQNTNLVGRPIPASPFDLTGVAGQFMTTSPYIGGYQIFPRSNDDILSTGPIFVTLPVEIDIQPTSLTLSWKTLNDGTSYLRYGKTTALELGTVGNDLLQKNHSVELAGLDPATIYYIKAFSASGSDTSFASTVVASTASPAQTSGAIRVMFNKSVDTVLAWYQPALQQQDLAARLLDRLRTAHHSIDAAFYSLSSTPGDNIAAELISARSRGVSVRVICEYDNRNYSGFTLLRGNGVPIIDDRFDADNAGAGLMHNKFVVIDGRGGAPESVFVWTGSWNPTFSGTYDDYQNAIEVQDVALAGAYTAEFNEMWGSSSDVPNAATSRFGARKTDNTPHRFVIGGRWIECYFSPSDRVTSHIVAAINGAAHSVAFNLLTLTRDEIANAIIAAQGSGVKVRGALDNNTDSGSEYNYLVANGVDIRLKTGTTALLHHKYAVLDGEDPHWNSVILTGSHNWTTSAETSNNENLLIVRDGNIANQYLQEFAARYYQFGGADSILVGVLDPGADTPSTLSLDQNYPNPFNPKTLIQFRIPTRSLVKLEVFDLLGRSVARPVNEVRDGGKYVVEWDAKGMASGVYFYRLSASGPPLVRRMVLLR